MNFDLITVIIYFTVYLKFTMEILFIPNIIVKLFFNNYSEFILICKNITNISISFITHLLLFKNIYVNSNEFIEELENVSKNKNIIISNHINDIDFLLFTIILSNCPLNFNNIFVSKKTVAYKLPIFGFFGILTGDILLHRKIENDIYKLKNIVNFNNLIIFPEGTCFTKIKKKITDDYCDKNKLIKFNYHLYPRLTGIKTIFQENKNIYYIYDFTIINDKINLNNYNEYSKIFNFIFDKFIFPNKIYIHINKYKIKKNNIVKQIENIFYSKDRFIKNFDVNSNKFIPIKYNYTKGFICFIIINFFTITSIIIFIKYNFFKYIFTTELLLYYFYCLLFV